jgi:uncharacterized protein (TIGR02453 family)
MKMKTIEKSTIIFLSDLKKNNNRDWFLNNQVRYKESKNNFETFIQDIINNVAAFEPIMKGLEVKSCVFRINRDIRFSHDKSPYKSNFGAFIVRGGKKNGDKFAGYYIHIEPGKSFIAGGAYMPPQPWLASIRENIDNQSAKFINILNNKDFVKYFGKIDGDKLKTVPKGYSSDNPNIDLLKFKSYLALNEVTDKVVLSAGYSDYVISVLKAMKPFNDFLNDY